MGNSPQQFTTITNSREITSTIYHNHQQQENDLSNLPPSPTAGNSPPPVLFPLRAHQQAGQCFLQAQAQTEAVNEQMAGVCK